MHYLTLLCSHIHAYTGPSELLQCIKLCYKFNLYDKCTTLYANCQISSKHEVHLLKAKTLFHLYTREFRYLCIHSNSLDQQDADQIRQSCYSKVEECIKLFGKALDNNNIDPEGSKMLDQCMIDYIRGTNNLNKLKRCFLCRKKCTLKMSHIWPKSYLRSFAKVRNIEFSSKIFVNSQAKRPNLTSAGNFTYWMLCGECEQRISQNGENRFSNEVFNVICSASGCEDMGIPYEPWLYDFPVGLLFRCFVFFRIECHENYSIFLQCRKHLLNLPLKYHGQSVDRSQDANLDVREFPSEQQISSGSIQTCQDEQTEKQTKHFLKQQTSDMLVTKVEDSIPFVILVNPTKVDSKQERALIESVLFTIGATVISEHYLSTGEFDFSRQDHFCAIQLGPINFLLPLGPSVTDYHPPSGCVVSHNGGRLFIAAEPKRWDLIPKGLRVEIMKGARRSWNFLFHFLAGANWQPGKQKIPHDVTVDITQSHFVSQALGETQAISLLPKEMKLVQDDGNESLQLPDSHFILCHGTINSSQARTSTVFLVAHFEACSSVLKMYTITIMRNKTHRLVMGAYIDIDADGKLHVADPLVDMKHDEDHILYRQHMEYLLPMVLKSKGFDMDIIETLIQRVRSTRLVHPYSREIYTVCMFEFHTECSCTELHASLLSVCPCLLIEKP